MAFLLRFDEKKNIWKKLKRFDFFREMGNLLTKERKINKCIL